ncbi:MAG: hypothetical protein ABRQ26_13995 [Syntrophomonadaceae bacterium]
MSLLRFVGNNMDFGEWLKIWSSISLFIHHLNIRDISVPVEYVYTINLAKSRDNGVQMPL